MTSRSRSGTKRKLSAADTADRHQLYQDTVQCVEAEIDFVDATYRSLRGRHAKVLREDFCGTANTACEWTRRRNTNRAIGIDLDTEVLGWGERNNVASLSPAQQKRIALVNGNVMDGAPASVDIVLAMNFSYWIFKDRALMRRYFKRVHHALDDDGVFFLDAYGGYDSYRVTKDKQRYDSYTYIWDQAAYNPINGDMTCHIHFHFPDGSKLKQAFSYHWRLWSLPEIQELLDEAGFRNVTVYWQGTDEETGDGDGEFTPATEGDPDPAWIAYISAEK